MLHRGLIRASPQRDCRWREAVPIRRHAVTERRGFLARITNVVQLVVPALDVGAVRGFSRSGNWHVTVLGKCEKRGFARQRDGRGPVRRKPDKSRAAQIQCENRVAICAVQVQTEKCEPQRIVKDKMVILVLAVVKNLKRAVKSRNLVELRFSPGFQIAQQIMLPMTRPVDLIIFVIGIFA